MENNSWIKLFRKFREWEWYDNSNVKDLFLELLLTVNFEDKQWHGILIKRGQIVTGIEELGKRIGLNRQQTRTAIAKLISTNEITKSSTPLYTIITVNNYDKYQEVTKLVTNEQPSSNQVVTTTKEYKEIKNITYISKNYLLTIPKEDLQEISKDIGVSTQSIINKGKELYDWCEANGKTKKNYRAFLRVCLRGDIKKQIPESKIKDFNSLLKQ